MNSPVNILKSIGYNMSLFLGVNCNFPKICAHCGDTFTMPQDTPDIVGIHLLCHKTHLTLWGHIYCATGHTWHCGDTSTVPHDTPDIVGIHLLCHKTHLTLWGYIYCATGHTWHCGDTSTVPQDTPDIVGIHLLCHRTHLTLWGHVYCASGHTWHCGDTSTVPQDTPDIAEQVKTYGVVRPICNDCLQSDKPLITCHAQKLKRPAV